MYPKVKVKAQRDEDEQYAYEKRSLQSLKAYGWLSPQHYSSSSSVARVPWSYVPQSPPPTFQETHAKKAGVGKSRGSARATSAPRPRAVLSSPDNDGIYGTKTQTRRELLLGLKDHNQCHNRHTRCKIFSTLTSFAPMQGSNDPSAEPRNDIPAKSRAVPAESSGSAGYQKKTGPLSIQS